MTPLYPHEALEVVEAAIMAIVPVNLHGAYDGFIVCSGMDEAFNVDRDRSVLVDDESPPTRKAGSGGCDLATMVVTVTVLYGTSRESRARRLTDAWKIEQALRALRDVPNSAIRLSKPEAQPTAFHLSGGGAMSQWLLTLEFFTPSVAV